MKIYYLLSLTHNRELEDGMLKQVTDQFLLDAVSYTDAETIAYAFAERTISGEFMIKSLVKTNIAELVVDETEDKLFKCKVVYSTVDGDSEKEKVINTYLMVSAGNVKDAYERVDQHLNSMLVPFEIPSITLTKVLEVINSEDYETNSNLNTEV